MGFERMVDRNLEPPEEKVIGYDWEEQELYGGEYGYMIDGEFVMEDDIGKYIEANYGNLMIYEEDY